MSTAPLASVLAEIDAALPGSEARLMEFLRIPSVSAQPAHAADCIQAASWACAQLQAIGFSAAVHATGGHPAVVAHHPGTGRAHAPRALFYGHYDVQPADDLALWQSPPFDPDIVPGPHGPQIRARGAVDDKGQTMMWLEALRAWHRAAGGPPGPVTVLIEGEEEVGSANLEAFLTKNAAALRADLAVISDTNMWDIDTPAITTRLRGLLYVQIDLFAASRDLHSGLFGGAAANPLTWLARLLGRLHDEAGRIALPGFYDGVAEVSAEQARQWDALGFDEAAFLGGIGLSLPAGEQGRAALERLWARPTAEVNGIWGGYMGAGSKTVIPAEAHAKLSFRLVPGQNPENILQGLRDFVQAQLPEDLRADIQVFSQSPAMLLPEDSRFLEAAETALRDEYGRAPVRIGSGGSIPVVESLQRLLGIPSLMVGFGLEDDQIHGPNEKFELRCFHKGIRSHARLLAELAML